MMVVAHTGKSLTTIFTSSTLVSEHNFHGFGAEPDAFVSKSPSVTMAAFSKKRNWSVCSILEASGVSSYKEPTLYGSCIFLFFIDATITWKIWTMGLPKLFLYLYLLVPDMNTIMATIIETEHIPYATLRLTSSCKYTSTVTAARVPKLMKKKNLLKKYAIWDFSFSSFSSNWSEPNPETLDFRPPVPSAIRYSDKYKIPI
ncbi:hypothetical protein V8G54_014616 [Vigna mungo]|uniref:Uncharacterized protein n=1 Tax=Vigna mungo TaxID=3915 RepID=A0AAQ3NJE6_VIGMU